MLCSASLSFCPSSIMSVPDGLQWLCVFGLTLSAVLSWPEAHGQRTVDVVELWCGVGSIAGAAAAAGYVVHKFDKFRVPGVSDVAGPLSEDLLTSCGFQSAVRCVLSMREGALLWMGPVCSSFVFMNSSRCKRTLQNPMGDVDYRPVAEGNLHASVAAFLYALACLRGILPVVENPAGSLIFRFPTLESVIAFFSTGSALCCRCAFAAERMGKRFKKAYKLVGHAWVKHLCAPCKCKGRSALLIGPPCRKTWQGPHIWEEGATTTICCLSNQDGEVCDPKVEETWIFILDIKQHSGAHDMEAPAGSSDMQQAFARPNCLLLILEDTNGFCRCPLSTHSAQSLLQLGSLCHLSTRLSRCRKQSTEVQRRRRWQHPHGKGLTLKLPLVRAGLARETVHCQQGRAALDGRRQTSEFQQ